jgi:MerR family mercuric resistance operon transcriptional regulator
VRQFALEKVREMETKIDHFMRLKEMLLDLGGKCRGEGPLADCPIIESLTQDLKEEKP